MSYNTGWDEAGSNLAYGNQGGLGAFDIAALQALYGANHATGAGDNTYDLPTGTTGWSCLWDAGGTDTIAAAPGSAGSTIDLRAATLREGDPNAGGFVSSEDYVTGGFTITNGVTIENATGAGGPDDLSGNAVANTLLGGGGRNPVGRRRQRCAPRRLGSGHFRVRYEAEQAHEQGLDRRLQRGRRHYLARQRSLREARKGQLQQAGEAQIRHVREGLQAQAGKTGSSTTARRACSSTTRMAPVRPTSRWRSATLKKGLKMTYEDFFVV